MKKVLVSLCLILVFSVASFSQAPVISRQQNFTAATNGASIGVFGAGATLHRITWQINNGTASACTMILQDSNDNSTFATLIPSQTCTSNGGSLAYVSAKNYIRISVSTLTLTTGASLNVRYEGFIAPIANTMAPVTTDALQVAGGVWTFIELSTGSGVTSVKGGPGILHSITINQKGANSLAVFKCFNNLAGTGNTALYIDTSLQAGTFFYDIYFDTAIVCSLAGTPDVTVAYR